jgi:hypothetical protein
MSSPSEPSENGKTPTLLQTVGSVLAAFFGVQSGRNRERDFKHGRAGVFIAVGIVMTILFVLSLWLVVKLVLKQAGV